MKSLKSYVIMTNSTVIFYEVSCLWGYLTKCQLMNHRYILTCDFWCSNQFFNDFDKVEFSKFWQYGTRYCNPPPLPSPLNTNLKKWGMYLRLYSSLSKHFIKSVFSNITKFFKNLKNMISKVYLWPTHL